MPNFFKACSNVLFPAYGDQFAVLDFDVYGLVVARTHDQGLVRHAFIPIQEGEYHIEMNEGFRGVREFLHENVLYLVLPCG